MGFSNSIKLHPTLDPYSADWGFGRKFSSCGPVSGLHLYLLLEARFELWLARFLQNICQNWLIGCIIGKACFQ